MRVPWPAARTMTAVGDALVGVGTPLAYLRPHALLAKCEDQLAPGRGFEPR